MRDASTGRDSCCAVSTSCAFVRFVGIAFAFHVRPLWWTVQVSFVFGSHTHTHARATQPCDRYLVRIYALNVVALQPLDSDGSSDPYVKIKIGKKTINDRANFLRNTTEPQFYKCFEVGATLPGASLAVVGRAGVVLVPPWRTEGVVNTNGCASGPGQLSLQVWNHNRLESDEEIGSTVIDLEDRWFAQKWRVCSVVWLCSLVLVGGVVSHLCLYVLRSWVWPTSP